MAPAGPQSPRAAKILSLGMPFLGAAEELKWEFPAMVGSFWGRPCNKSPAFGVYIRASDFWKLPNEATRIQNPYWLVSIPMINKLNPVPATQFQPPRGLRHLPESYLT